MLFEIFAGELKKGSDFVKDGGGLLNNSKKEILLKYDKKIHSVKTPVIFEFEEKLYE